MSGLLGAPNAARAQVTAEPSAVVFPDPAKFAHGLYTEGEVGAVTFFGAAGADVAPGFAVGTRIGYDLFRWFAVQAHFLGSTHAIRGSRSVMGLDANGNTITVVQPNPQAGQLLQTYQAIAEGKLTLRFGQTSLFAEGGAGLERLSTNVLYTLMLERYRVGFTAGGGGGIDYHSLSRHFSVGLRGDYFWMREISGSQDLMVTTYLRYTF
jgi:hypothetical protein